jgi:hypothetical protein
VDDDELMAVATVGVAVTRLVLKNVTTAEMQWVASPHINAYRIGPSMYGFWGHCGYGEH